MGYSIAIDDIVLLRDTSTISSTDRHDVTNNASTALALTDHHYSTPSMTMAASKGLSIISETSSLPLIETTTVDPTTLAMMELSIFLHVIATLI